MRPAVPERGQRGQRFAKTIAELQRYQAATRPSEPWGNVVPRPAVPQAAPGGEADTAGRASGRDAEPAQASGPAPPPGRQLALALRLRDQVQPRAG